MMRIIDADETRMIDLPGVGPCPRPVDIDQAVTGFARLKSLRIYRFAPGAPIEGESEGDEVYVTALDGAIDLTINGPHPLVARLARGEALYMTPGHSYRLVPQAGVRVAYARAAARGVVATHVVRGAQGDRAEVLRHELIGLPDGTPVRHDSTRERLIHVVAGLLTADGASVPAGATIALPGGATADLRAGGPATVLMVSA